jgi:autotransporter-associated beta strand protein
MTSYRNRTAARFIVLGLVLALVLLAHAAQAATMLTWSGSNGTWNTSSTNWPTATVPTPWDTGNGTGNIAYFNTPSITPTVSGTVSVNGIQFDSTATLGSGTINLMAGALTTPSITVNAASSTIGSTLIGTSGLVKSGTGLLTLTAANTLFTGGTTISQGTLQLNSTSGGPTAQGITLGDVNTGNNNLQLTYNNASLQNPITVANNGNGLATVNFSALIGSYTGLITLNRAATITGTGSPSNPAPTLTFGGSGTLTVNVPTSGQLILLAASPTFTGDIVVAAGTTFEPRNAFASNGNNITVFGTVGDFNATDTYGALNGNGTVHARSTPCTFVLGKSNVSGSFSGVINNNNSTTSLTKVGTATQALTGAGIVYTGATTLNQGTLNLTNATGFASTVTMSTSNTVDLQLASTGSSLWTFNRQILGGSTSAIIEAVGPGTVVLNPASGSTFVGSSTSAITVTAGSLFLTSSFGTAPSVYVGPLGTFGGSSTAAATTVASGGGIIGGYAGAGALTMNSLTFSGTGSLQGTLALGITPIVVNGAVTTSGSNTIAVTAANLPTDGLYSLLSYGSGADPFAAFKLASPSRTLTLVDSSSAGLIQISVNSTTFPIWTGLTSGDWSLATEPGAKNWRVNTGGTTDFLAGDKVMFDDSVGTAGSTNITINNGNVNPGSITVNNNLYNYTISGSNGITTGSLAKNGTGTLTINTANSYAGGTTLNGGTLILGNNAALGSGTLGIADGTSLLPNGGPVTVQGNVSAPGNFTIGAGTNSLTLNGTVALSVTGTNTITVNGPVVFASAVTGNNLVQTGAGMLTLGASNSFPGTVTVSQGTMQLNNAASAGIAPIALGDANTGGANVQLNINSSGVLNNITVANPATINYLVSGAAQTFSASAATWTLNAPATFTGPNLTATSYVLFMPALSGTAAFNVGTTNNARMILQSNDSAYSGDITVQSGAILEPRNELGTANGNNITLNAGGTLNVWFNNLSINALNGTGVVSYNASFPAAITVGIGNGSGAFAGTSAGAMAWTKTGTGTQELGGSGITYTGATTLTQGTLRLTNATGWGSNVNMDFFNPVDLQLNNTSGTTWTFSKQINGGSTSGVIETVGSGTVVLAPAVGSTFNSSSTGALTVTSGALYLTNTNLNSFTPPAVAVGAGGTFGGNSTVGTVVIANGGGIVGGYGGAGALTMNSLTFSGTGTAAGFLAAGTTPLVINNSVTAGPASIAVTPANLPGDGVYPFLSYTGTDPFSDFTLSTSVIGRSVLSLIDSSASNLIAISLSTTAYPIWTGQASGDWSFATQPSPKNWRLSSGGATDFLNGDTVVFDDSVGTGTTNVTINNGNVTPASTTFNNNLYNYTLSGSNGITTGSLRKGGTGSLTINTANSYAGGTTLNAGTLIIGNNSALGSGGLLINGGWLQPAGGPITLANSINAGGDFAIGGDVNSLTVNGLVGLSSTGTTTITVNGTGGVAFNNVVTGNNLVKSGTGMLTLGAVNSFTGGVTVSQGTLQLTGGTAAGANAITLGDANTGANNIQLTVTNPAIANDIIVANQGTSGVTLSLVATTNVVTWGSASNTVTLNRAMTITTPVETSYISFYPTFSGSGDLDIGSTNASQGGWLILLNPSPSFTGNVVIGNNAVFEPRDQLSAFGGNNVTVQSGGTLQLIAFGATSIAGLSGNGDVRCRYQGTMLTIGNGDASATFSGTLENGEAAWNLVKTGMGTEVLTGAPVAGVPTATSSFTGGVTVNGGTLVLAAVASGSKTVIGAATSNRTITVNAGGMLEFVTPNTLGSAFNSTSIPTLAISGGTVTNAEPGAPYPAGFINNALNNVSLTNGVLTATTGQHGGYAAWNINGTVTSSGDSLISTSDPIYGTVMLNSTGGSSSVGVTTFNVTDGTLTVSAPLVQDMITNDHIAGSGLKLIGGGTMVLTGTNTYSGGTTVNDGTLIATNNEAFADGSSLAVGDPSLLGQLPAAAVPAPLASAAVAAVPEPGTLVLLAAASSAALAARRRKSKSLNP